MHKAGTKVDLAIEGGLPIRKSPVAPWPWFSEAEIAAYREALPELPEVRRQRFLDDYALSADDAALLTDSRAMADYYEAAARAAGNAKAAANWILNELLRELNSSGTEIRAEPI